jgi:acyl-CoA reductase-like NAD-dependent aldehyde dehydrogenase
MSEISKPNKGGRGKTLPATDSSGVAKRGKAEQGQKLAATGSSGVAERTPHEPSAASRQSRIAVRKTYKLYIGGAYPRSESGRSYSVYGAKSGELLAYAARASRKDVRDAVVAARAAVGKWAGATAYNRGQVLYRVAEMIEGRAGQFADEVGSAEGISARAAQQNVAAVIDRWVWYAGWPDKVAQVAGGANPVAGPYFNFSVPEPTGVVAVIAPAESSLLGLSSVIAPVIATGNTVVVVASQDRPLPAITLSEVLGTSDVPGGVVNVLTGHTAELAPVLAGHFDVNAIDLTGVPASGPGGRAELERLAASNVKRVFCADEDWAAAPAPRRLLAFLETKTIWHPVGI